MRRNYLPRMRISKSIPAARALFLELARLDVQSDNAMTTPRTICDVCGTAVPPHAHFLVRMDVFADPTMPPINTDDLDEANITQTLDELMKQIETMSADDLQDGVHRRFEYRLCGWCHKQFLSNPLGLPRRKRLGEN